MSSFFVKIQGIQGDATAAGREGEIECSRMRHVIDQPVSSTSDPRKLGTSRHGALEFVHGIGKATPALAARGVGWLKPQHREHHADEFRR